MIDTRVDEEVHYGESSRGSKPRQFPYIPSEVSQHSSGSGVSTVASWWVCGGVRKIMCSHGNVIFHSA